MVRQGYGNSGEGFGSIEVIFTSPCCRIECNERQLYIVEDKHGQGQARSIITRRFYVRLSRTQDEQDAPPDKALQQFKPECRQRFFFFSLPSSLGWSFLLRTTLFFFFSLFCNVMDFTFDDGPN